MKVNLVSVTQSGLPVAGNSPIHGGLSPEELIVYIARVSNPGNQTNTATAGKLLKYLIDHKHWSPFEHVYMTVEIVTSRAIAQQIIRHRSFTFQEFSQRYAEVTEFEPIQLRKQAEKNRQSSTEEFDPHINIFSDESGLPAGNYCASGLTKRVLRICEMAYKKLLEAGVAKESARFILPVDSQTTIYMTGSVRSWIHYLQQRLDEHTQLEHRQIAVEIADIFGQLFPNIYQEVFA